MLSDSDIAESDIIIHLHNRQEKLYQIPPEPLVAIWNHVIYSFQFQSILADDQDTSAL